MTRKIKIKADYYTIEKGTIMTVTGECDGGWVVATVDGNGDLPWRIHPCLYEEYTPIKLEVGKWYELNNGDVVECVKESRGIYAMGDYVYEKDGEFIGSDMDHRLSVKSEVPAPTPETGTLAELNVKSGDVVEFQYDGKYTVMDDRYLKSHQTGVHINYCGLWDVCDKFRIMSRSAPTPTLWRDMTDAEKGALLLAKHEGKVIEWNATMPGKSEWEGWTDCPDGCLWDGDYDRDGFAYRVKPEPVRKEVRVYGRKGKSFDGYWSFSDTNISSEDTHTITFDTVDGAPDTSSIRMDPVS